MRAGGTAGGADLADHLADLHDIADLDVARRQMAVAGGQPVAVVDLDHAAVAALPAGGNDLAVGGGADGIAGGGAEIQARMHRGPAEEGITAHAEAGGEFDFADDGLAIGHQRQRAVQLVDLRAGDVDAIELAVEGAGVAGKLYGDEGTADSAARRCRFELREVEAEVVDDPAHASRPR